jgi:cell division protein FtsB
VPAPATDEGEDHDPVHAEKLDSLADPNAKLRAEFRRLSDEGQEDDWIALRADNAALQERVEKQTGMIADLKSKHAGRSEAGR